MSEADRQKLLHSVEAEGSLPGWLVRIGVVWPKSLWNVLKILADVQSVFPE